MATVFERVKRVTVVQLGVTEDEVTPDSNFATDLGADSLDQVELMMALEEEFSTSAKKITIPDEESEKMLSVQDAVDFLHGIGISDVETPPKPVEKSGFPRFNFPRPNISRPNQPRQDRPQDKQQNRPAGAGPQRGGQQQQRRDNRPRRDRPQGNAPRPNVNPRPAQQPPPPQPPQQPAPQKPPEPGNQAS